MTVRTVGAWYLRVAIGFVVVCVPVLIWARVHVVDRTDFLAGQGTNGWMRIPMGWRSPCYPTNPICYSVTVSNAVRQSLLCVSNTTDTTYDVTLGKDTILTSFTAEYDLSRLQEPKNVSVTNLLPGSFFLTWQAVPDALGYRLVFATNDIAGASSVWRMVEVSAETYAYYGVDFPCLDGTVSVIAVSQHAWDDSLPVTLSLPLANPPLMPILRACPISVLDEACYQADFSALTSIVSQTKWYNGVSPIPYWMGYDNRGELVSSLRPESTNSNYSGFFACTGKNAGSGALGFRGASDRTFYWGLSFENDTQSACVDFRLRFRYGQWNWRNSITLTNILSCLVTNTLVPLHTRGKWRNCALIVPPYKVGTAADAAWWNDVIELPVKGLRVSPGSFLHWRITQPAISLSGGVALDTFEMSFRRQNIATCIILR